MMPVHVLIDGYNLIRRSATLRSQEKLALELGRDSLLEHLRQYKSIRGHRITVVFDAAGKTLSAEERSQHKGIRVIYSSQGETADSVIKRFCREEGRNLLVVTSDKELANYAETCGSVVMDSGDFEDKMEMALYLESKGAEVGDEEEGWSPSKGTHKKGPAKRRSKRERRRLEKYRKL
jgi:hypothetical protein